MQTNLASAPRDNLEKQTLINRFYVVIVYYFKQLKTTYFKNEKKTTMMYPWYFKQVLF